MGIFKVILLSWLILSFTTQADTLVLSKQLKLDYPAPLLISHTKSTLIIKYKDTSISHNILDPKDMYANVDLTGYQKDYIYTLFDKKPNKTLPKPIMKLAEQQKTTMGLTKQKGLIKEAVNYELLASYDDSLDIGHIFLLEDKQIQHFAIDGTHEFLTKVFNGIKER